MLKKTKCLITVKSTVGTKNSVDKSSKSVLLLFNNKDLGFSIPKDRLQI